jgi:hypothetical protein
MTNKKRLTGLFLVLLLWGVGKVFNLYQIHFPNRNHRRPPRFRKNPSVTRAHHSGSLGEYVSSTGGGQAFLRPVLA